MKVVITVNTYYPLKDGVQSVTGYLAEGLSSKGHEVVVITSKNGNKDVEIHNNVKILRIEYEVKWTLYRGDKKKFQQTLLHEVSNADVLINVCTQTPLTDWSYPLLDSVKCRKILYLHGIHENNWKSSSFSQLSHNLVNNIRWTLYYLTIGKYMAKYDKVTQLHRFDYGYSYFKKRFNINSNIMENAAESIFFKKTNLCIDNHYAISVANYMKRKNQEMILRSFYKAQVKDYGLVLIGSTTNHYYEELIKLNKELEKEYGNHNVKILSGISREDTINYIKNASLYLLGSTWEAFPISIVESMASGIPFISTDVGIVKYLPGGIIVHSEEEMTYWISLLINHEVIKNELGEIGYRYASKHLTIENKVNQLELLCKA